MSSGRQDDGNALLGEVIAQVSGGGDAVAQVILIDGLLQADGNGFQVASGKAAIGGIALGEDEQILFLLRQQIVVGAEKSADVGHAVFLGAHGAAVAEGEHLLGNLLGSFVLIAGLAQLDEVGVLGEAAGVKVQRDVVACGRVR